MADRSYYGEVAIHFVGSGSPLLLPISIAQQSALCVALEQYDEFVSVESLDNRTVLIRRSAIADVFFSSDACDDYGPDDYGTQHLGIHTDDAFWKIAEYFDCTEALEGAFTEAEIMLARAEAIGDGHPESVTAVLERFTRRARLTEWQLSDGRSRSIFLSDSSAISSLCNALRDGEAGEAIRFGPDGYHRLIFLNPRAVDYVAVPSHKLREVEVELAADDLSENV